MQIDHLGLWRVESDIYNFSCDLADPMLLKSSTEVGEKSSNNISIGEGQSLANGVFLAVSVVFCLRQNLAWASQQGQNLAHYKANIRRAPVQNFDLS